MELTDEEITQAESDAQELMDRAREIISTFKSNDMDTDKILGRIGIMSALNGGSRTSVLGAVAYAATYGPVVGLTRDQIVGVVDALFATVEKLPSTPEAKVRYAAANAAYQEKQKEQIELQSGGSLSASFVSPGNNKVH